MTGPHLNALPGILLQQPGGCLEFAPRPPPARLDVTLQAGMDLTGWVDNAHRIELQGDSQRKLRAERAMSST